MERLQDAAGEGAAPHGHRRARLPFQLAIVMLGLSAAFGGTLVETQRTALGDGVCIRAVRRRVPDLRARRRDRRSSGWSSWATASIGGIGLGIGYISPVSTLIKWFPDRPGMATGIAIMGFGGGALIASPWSTPMLAAFGTDHRGHRDDVPGHGVVYAVVHVARLAARAGAGRRLEAGRLGAEDRPRPGHDHRRERLGGQRRSRRRSSGCCGWCCASTSPRASASWRRRRR